MIKVKHVPTRYRPSALTPAMQEALRLIGQTDRVTFETLIYDPSDRLIGIVKQHTMDALERRGLIEVDHVVKHEEPWIVDNVFYRLTHDAQ